MRRGGLNNMNNNLEVDRTCIEEFNVSMEQLRELVQLTNRTLEHLNCELIIVRNVSEFVKTDFYQSVNDESRQKLDDFMISFNSFYICTHNLIVMLLDDIEGQTLREKAIQFAHTLFHELRHAWQFKNNIFDMSKLLQTKNEGYLKQPHEIDAVIYSEWATNHYKKEVANIFNIDSEWTIKSSFF